VQYKKKIFIIIAINVLFISCILLLAIPTYKYLSKGNVADNEFVKGQVIINPEAKSPAILDRTLSIKFIAKVDQSLNLEFEPLQENIKVNIGENNIIKYKGKNVSNKTITSTANFIVDPIAAQVYLIKTECFCFTEQTLQPGEEVDMAVSFYIDPEFVEDENVDEIKEMTLSYTFFPSDDYNKQFD
jgi:cytochrome c oxidase assembly protein subunit 11